MLRKEVGATILALNPIPTEGGGLFFCMFCCMFCMFEFDGSGAQDLYHSK